MFKKISSLLFAFIILFVIWSCGTMSQPDDELSVPQKVSLHIPKALKSKKKRAVEKESLAYIELKEDVAYLETLRTDVEVYLLFLNQVIHDIDERCQDILLDNPCIIPEDELSFIFDKNISEAYIALTHEKAVYDIDEELSFGEIKFTQYANADKYDYRITMDTSFDSIDELSSETIEWSKNGNHILAFYEEESSSLKSEIKIDYVKEESGEKRIVVDDAFWDKKDKSSDTFHFDLLEKRDENETYVVASSSLSIDTLAKEYSFDSIGELSSKGGFLDFEGTFNEENFQEYEEFDGNGVLLEGGYCYENSDCDMENPETWFSF